MAAKKPQKKTPRKQREGRSPVVDRPNSPRMGEVEIRPRRIDRKIVTMDPEPKASKAKANTMKAFRPGGKKARENHAPSGDQVAREAEQANHVTGYLRLRLHVEKGEVTVQGAKHVPGPLDRVGSISPGVSYVARIGDRQIAAGDVPEPTEWRSFPDPAQRAGLEGHHVTEVESFDVTVRVPAEELDEQRLGDLNVELVRWRGKGPGDRIDVDELAKQPKAAITQLGTLRGVELETVPADVRRSLRAALKHTSD